MQGALRDCGGPAALHASASNKVLAVLVSSRFPRGPVAFFFIGHEQSGLERV